MWYLALKRESCKIINIRVHICEPLKAKLVHVQSYDNEG